MLRGFRSLSIIVAVSAAAFAPAALAGESGFYISATGGLTWQNDQDLQWTSPSGSERGEARLDSGFLAGGAFGYDFGNGWRVEGEFIYQSVDHGGGALTAPGVTGEGNYASTSIGVNGLYEFDLFGSPKARTYVGAGLAFFDEIDIDFEGEGIENSYSGGDIGFQILAGARYDVGERFFLDAGLRCVSVSSVDLEDEGTSGQTISADYQPWSVTAGVGFRF
ncbi:MAG: porin family protein [Acidobacteria bacterium]|nr:porin family protein [Acidobacteriota bacterium]